HRLVLGVSLHASFPPFPTLSPPAGGFPPSPASRPGSQSPRRRRGHSFLRPLGQRSTNPVTTFTTQKHLNHHPNLRLHHDDHQQSRLRAPPRPAHPHDDTTSKPRPPRHAHRRRTPLPRRHR